MARVEIFKEIKNRKMQKLYESMWEGNSVVLKADVINTPLGKMGTNGVVKDSKNSYSFSGENKAQALIDTFDIPAKNQKLFRKKFKMVCGGNGHEDRKITTLHSSSLCSLLFFYNVTENNKLKIDGIGTFTKSIFEYKSPVVKKNHDSCMDVVLIGKDEAGKDALLFLESKFSEYYITTAKRLKNISDNYLKNKYSQKVYSTKSLAKLGMHRSEAREGFFDLESDEAFYISGIKQMISHYVGLRNNLDKNHEFAKQKTAGQERVTEVIKAGAKIYLAEIVFDHIIGDFKMRNGKSYGETYAEKYKILAELLNEEIKNAYLDNRLSVIPHELKYSMFVDEGMEYKLDDNVKGFYWGWDEE